MYFISFKYIVYKTTPLIAFERTLPFKISWYHYQKMKEQRVDKTGKNTSAIINFI